MGKDVIGPHSGCGPETLSAIRQMVQRGFPNLVPWRSGRQQVIDQGLIVIVVGVGPAIKGFAKTLETRAKQPMLWVIICAHSGQRPDLL